MHHKDRYPCKEPLGHCKEELRSITNGNHSYLAHWLASKTKGDRSSYGIPRIDLTPTMTYLPTKFYIGEERINDSQTRKSNENLTRWEA
ncbi:nucleotide-binding protein [Acrasis kona]|uniref:Nucleotide-binding protein n=1 Tax=Acrasis kona TaxID=1008807 RepID=A0AAW2Z1Q6_9EUKA